MLRVAKEVKKDADDASFFVLGFARAPHCSSLFPVLLRRAVGGVAVRCRFTAAWQASRRVCVLLRGRGEGKKGIVVSAEGDKRYYSSLDHE